MTESHYDLIIIGLGAMGSAALYQAAKAGARVLGIDRYAPPHEFGSSHAETRITRLAVGEGPQYLPLVARSHEIWRELEAQTGEPLLYQSGGYIITKRNASSTSDSHWDNFVQRTAAVAQLANVPFEIRTPDVARTHLPYVLIGDDDEIGYEPSGGVVLSERAVATQIELAQRLGATTRLNEPVVELLYGTDAVTVVTAQGRYVADKVIVSAGPWMRDFLPASRHDLLHVTRQVVHWFEVEEPERFSTDKFPFFIWVGDTTADYFSAFPMPPGGVPGLKVLTEEVVTTVDPESVRRHVTQEEIDAFYDDFVVRRIDGVARNSIKASVCLYTHTPTEHFLIDQHPACDRVLLASPCSGHGFKHSAAIGESMVQRALNGKSVIDLSAFGWARFGHSS